MDLMNELEFQRLGLRRLLTPPAPLGDTHRAHHLLGRRIVDGKIKGVANARAHIPLTAIHPDLTATTIVHQLAVLLNLIAVGPNAKPVPKINAHLIFASLQVPREFD